MKRKYLGDSLDHVKRTVIAGCEECGSANIHVVPMVTDDPTWEEDDPAWDTYAWLLGRDRIAILNRAKPFAFVRDATLKLREQYDRWMLMRREYFKALDGFEGDLFLDPDTGLAFADVERAYDRGRPKKNDHGFVHRHELELLTKGNERLIILYQHKHQGDPEGCLDKAKLRLGEKCLPSFGYWLSHISILFICRSADRLGDAKRYFDDRLRGATGRIR